VSGDSSSDCARQIVAEILADAKDRRGFRQLWESLDADIQREIELAWRKIAEDRLTKCREGSH
jgi:Putative addiction module component